jgi:hypothetical protein
MCLRNGIFLKNTALMLASIVVTHPDHGVPKCPKPLDQARIKKAKSEFSKNGGGRGGRGAVADAAIQVVVVVAMINPTQVESGITTIELQLHLLLPLAVLENIRASGV